jgi:iron complex outermembrane receptor protein
VANTAVELEAYGAGLSYVGDGGFVGLAVKRTQSRYGVPGHAHEDHEHEEADHAVAIDLAQTRYDLRGAWNLDLGPFERARFSGGYADYEHVELEGGAPATRFLSDGWEGRLELIQRERDGWQGAVGMQGLSRSLDAQGEEAYVPSVEIRELGLFTLQRLDRDRWGVEGGLRLDRREVESATASREFTNLSASLGAFLRPADGWFLGLSASRTARGPTEAELFADGAHAATRGYERGDATLDAEVSHSLDGTIHYGGGRWEADLHLFGVSDDGVIDLRPTGEVDADSGLAVFVYRQTDASFHGGEADVAYRFWRQGADSLTFHLLADYVRGDTDLGAPARIPPWSLGGRAVAAFGPVTTTLELRRVGEQARVAEFELPTEAYTLLNASLVYRPMEGVKVFAEGRNLNDAEAREHASFLKDLAPLPGRSLRLGVAYSF